MRLRSKLMESSHQDADQKVFQLANQEAWKSDYRVCSNVCIHVNVLV